METTPFSVGKLLSQLIDRPVQMARVDEPAAAAAPATVFATYGVVPQDSSVLLKIDFATLALLAGLMIALPAAQIEKQAAKGVFDEQMTDASREVLNVLSAVIVGQGRAVFETTYARATELPAQTQAMLRQGGSSRLCLRCSVAGKPVGHLTIVAA